MAHQESYVSTVGGTGGGGDVIAKLGKYKFDCTDPSGVFVKFPNGSFCCCLAFLLWFQNDEVNWL